MQLLPLTNNNLFPNYSNIIISNDLTSKLIHVHKDTEIQTFYQEILMQFPNLKNMKLFYFEGYSKKYYITNEEEYIIANKKGIEYFYLCENANNVNNDNILDYLRYYSVMFFTPVKRLNTDFQINERKKMKLKNFKMNQMNNQINININNFCNQMQNLNLNNNNDLITNINICNDDYNNNINIPKEIQEYETIDTESNPVNRFIENAINYSSFMKYIIASQRITNPEYFENIDETLTSPGFLFQNYPSPLDHKYILCLLGKMLENKGIKVGIYKQSYNINRIDLSIVQFIFSGLINKKKYRLKFSRNISFVNIINNLSIRKKFIEEWKIKISNILQMDKSLIILTNPRNSNDSLYFDLAFNHSVVEINDKKLINALVQGDIIKCVPVSLLGGCILSPGIFDPKFNKYYNSFFQNKIVGGEEYIHPLQWTAYGINVSEKYDFGNNTWLGNLNNMGEFAVAYYGINNLNKNSLKKIDSLMGNSETGKTFIKVRNIRNPNYNCKTGIYFYKNPIHAENSSELINIGGMEYKIMFMCRIKSSKINQPENFKDCWILSATPDEVRPYKILIKKILKSPLFFASQDEIKICTGSPPQFYMDIITQRDESYMNKISNNYNMYNFNAFNPIPQNNFDLVLKEWTGLGAKRINDYLRFNIKNLPESELKSNIWCLHKAITKSFNNVPNNITLYRGIKAKAPFNIGIGTKFYFQEFLSTSKDINIARNFANFGTLLVISIQNNGINGKKVYCRDIENISQYPEEREVIITAFCEFKITKIEKQNNLDIIYLTCIGYNF